MRAVIVVETMFGGTLRIAISIANGLSGFGNTEIARVGSLPPSLLNSVDLLVAGAPTHAHGLSTADSRTNAAILATDPYLGLRLKGAEAGGEASGGGSIGVREWMDSLRASELPRFHAAFDTRLKGFRILTGAASVLIDHRLQELGSTAAVPPMSFLVGPDHKLLEGEIRRAEEWGQTSGRTVTELLRE